jgi:hypothetical protein
MSDDIIIKTDEKRFTASRVVYCILGVLEVSLDF